jgi:hypothetical protein
MEFSELGKAEEKQKSRIIQEIVKIEDMIRMEYTIVIIPIAHWLHRGFSSVQTADGTTVPLSQDLYCID